MLKKCKKTIYLLLLPKFALLVQVCLSNQLSFSDISVIASYSTTFVILAIGASTNDSTTDFALSLDVALWLVIFSIVIATRLL